MKDSVSPQTGSDMIKLPVRATGGRGNSPLWNRAVEKYLEELDEDPDAELLAGVGSLEDLISFTKTIEFDGSTSTTTLNRLGPSLKFVDDFAAVVAICLGANARFIAFVWGSLRLIIMLASSADDALQKALDMLEELSLSLPRLRYYEENLPLDRSLESTLVDLYSEMICFYARLIRHYRTNPHILMQQAGWQSFQRDFISTVRRVKYLSSIVEKEADLAKMKLESDKYEEVLEALKGLGSRKVQDEAIQQYHHINFSLNPRFRARESDLESIRKALSQDEKPGVLKSFALHGMGGVGKTQLALSFAIESKATFDVILWIAADTNMSLEQSFREAAVGLGLSQESNDGSNELSATARVKNWVSDPSNRSTWLMIFDNADDISVLRHVWPSNGSGSVLITSRDFTAASMVAASGLDMQPFAEDAGAETLLRLLSISEPSEIQRAEARKISRTLGGLPLALDQIAGFIIQRRLRIENFLPLYERNSAKIDARLSRFGDYPHTLATVFEMALENLTGPALHLQNLLAFMEPDSIPESIFEDGSDLVQDTDLEFLGDEMDLGDAEETLLQAALVSQRSGERSLSVHRLVQSATLRRLSEKDEQKYFKAAVDLLSLGFPETWSKDVGHQKKEWARCERYLPHMNTLVNLALKNPSIAVEPNSWAELLLRCSWYLYEKEQYTYAKTFTKTALDAFTDDKTLAYASAIDLFGLIDLDMALPQQALNSFERGHSIRQSILSPTDPFIAFGLNNLALAYTEMSDLTKAEELHKMAIKIRLENESDRIGNSYSNYAVTLLRMGKANDAERILMQCPSLKNCTDETFLTADNPRFVGDMVLLSRIRQAQGRKDEALRLASKALSWRQKVHGDRFKTCDSMFDVACLLHEQGQAATALELLDGIVKIAGTLHMGEGHAARAEWQASRILEERDKITESQRRAANAELLRKKAHPEEAKPFTQESQWKSLAPFMLW